VKPGDTMTRIGLETGQTAKDIARWSGVDNPHKIEVGQVLRVVPPVPSSAVPAAVASTSAATGVVTQPVTQASVTPTGNAAPPSSTTVSPVVAGGGDDDIAWIWPTSGAVLAGFDEVKNKGLDIAGSLGDSVVAAADGRVVYVGAGLRGYGNLIILKHNNTYLTAYAHNKSLLVIEDQAVRKGQKIAEMGNSDADRVKLHFEVRRQGKPVDPSKYLPSR
jgi:lipoprotein NlpD